MNLTNPAALKQNATLPPKSEQTPLVACALNDLDMWLSTLIDSFGVLAQRLIPVLNTTDCPTTKVQEPEKLPCELAERIAAAKERVRILNDTICTLSSKLEI